MSRLPFAAFAALVIATVAAFFVTQHLKTSTPLLDGQPAPFPAAINPISGGICTITGPKGIPERISFRRMSVSFYLLNRSDDVGVYIVDQDGVVVSTLASGRYMRGGSHPVRTGFVWNGRESNGSVAPDGDYYIRVSLFHQGRSVLISNNSGPEPVTVLTARPHPRVTSVVPSSLPRRGGGTSVTIHYTSDQTGSGMIELYRTDLPGGPRLVKSFITPSPRQVAWNGLILHKPAPQGVYLVGYKLADKACNTGTYPARFPVAPGTTPHAGVTVSYLQAQPPLDPVAAGSDATVTVDAVGLPYSWTLARAGAPRHVLASGSGSAATLSVPLPAAAAGLYKLSLRSGVHSTAVPIVASGTSREPILVVLPALTWQGQNADDEDGDGIPDTLDDGVPVALARPFLDGLPAGYGDQAGLLAYLDRAHLHYELTTDVGLIDGSGPGLSGHKGVVLAGSERWLPASVSAALRTYVEAGGHVLSLGIDSLRRGVTVSGGRAFDPTAAASTDVLGARSGALVPGGALTVDGDGLGIFGGGARAVRTIGAYEPIAPVSPAVTVAAAGTSRGAAIVGYKLGKGVVVDVGVPGFGTALGGAAWAQALLRNVWGLLGGRGH